MKRLSKLHNFFNRDNSPETFEDFNQAIILDKDEVVARRVVNCRFLGRDPMCVFNGFKCSFEDCKAAVLEEIKC